MWMAPIVLARSAPDAALLSLGRSFLRIDDSDISHDTEIGVVLAGVQLEIERVSGLQLFEANFRLRCSSFDDLASIPVAPIKSITSATMRAIGGDVTIDPYDLVIDGGYAPSITVLSSRPVLANRPDAIEMTVITGHGASISELPPDLLFVLVAAARAKFDGNTFEYSQALVNFRRYS